MQLFLLLSLFLFPVALGSPSDILYLEKLNADVAQVVDSKNLTGLVNIFTENAIFNYNRGAGTASVVGVDKIQALLARTVPPEVISARFVGTESFTLLPPFDEQGAASTATGVVYIALIYIGQGHLAGQSATLYGKFDDIYVKTSDFTLYGGWRISQRFSTEFVSCPRKAGNS